MRKLPSLIDDLEDTLEDYTPIHSSGTYPMWQTAARETAEKLEKLETIEATFLAGECRWYQDTLASWSPTNRPDLITRKRIVNELIDLLARTQKTLNKPKNIN